MQDFLSQQIFLFLLLFMRIGTAMMLMPGIGDSYVPVTTRLLFTLSFCFVLLPTLSGLLATTPSQPGSSFLLLCILESLRGVWIGTLVRILFMSLDMAGNIVSMQMGYSNSTIFNPTTENQGSMTSTLYSMLGIGLILITNLHHLILSGLVNSYHAFPPTTDFFPTNDMAQAIAKISLLSFQSAVQISMPFIIAGLLLQIGFGLLGRLLPQIQVFFIAMPVQLLLGLSFFALTLSIGIGYWMNIFQDTFSNFFR